MASPQQGNCQILYPGWATVEKAGYQCCLDAMSPTTLAKPALDQVRHVAQHCPGKAFGSTEITELRMAQKQRVGGKVSQASAAVAADAGVAATGVAAAEAGGGATDTCSSDAACSAAVAAVTGAADGIGKPVIIKRSTPVVGGTPRPSSAHKLADGLDATADLAWEGAGVSLVTGNIEFAVPLAVGAGLADLGSVVADAY